MNIGIEKTVSGIALEKYLKYRNYIDPLAEKLGAAEKILVAFSGGKDSLAMLLYLFELGIDKSKIEIHHHEVDGNGESMWDWACTPGYCKAVANLFHIPIMFSYRNGGISREILRENEPLQDIYYQKEQSSEFTLIPSKKEAINTRRKFPAVSASLITRWCSGNVKISVLDSVIRRRFNENQNIAVLTGERGEESKNRAAYSSEQAHTTNSQKRTVTQYRPILRWSELQVWNIIKQYNIQPHPAYELGFGRCSCQTCIFSSPNIWATNKEISPQKIEKLSQIEDNIGFTLYNNKTINQMATIGKSLNDGTAKWKYWAEIANQKGDFTAPIQPQKWQLPIGAMTGEKAGSL